MKRIAFIFVSILVLFGCKTYEGYKNYLLQFKGITKSELVYRLGVPDSVYEYGDTEYLVYNYSENMYIQQTSFVDGYSSYDITNGSISTYGGYTKTYNCKTTFYITKGVVTNIRFKGNGCVA